MSETGPTQQGQIMVLPAFGKANEVQIDLSNVREAESRIIEAKTVNPATYTDLEHCFNQSYRDLKRYLSSIGYLIMQAEKAMEEAKADVLLDKYPEFMKDKPKSQDNADLRKAFLMRDENYLAALDRYNQLRALESNLDGKVKVMERVCAYMKKSLDIILRNGTNINTYITSGRK